MLRGVGCGGLGPHGITVAAAAVKIGRNVADKLAQAIVPRQYQLHLNVLRVLNQRIPATSVLRIGVDVRVEPKADGLNAFAAQGFNAHDGTGGAADMQECFHDRHLVFLKIWGIPVPGCYLLYTHTAAESILFPAQNLLS